MAEIKLDEVLPLHIGIIMDGNGRWAKKRGLPRTSGHVQGAKTFRKCVDNCIEFGIKYATFYALSTENLSARPREEISALLKLLERNIDDLKKMERKNVQIKFIGDLSFFSEQMRIKMDDTMKSTETGTGLVCSIAVNYGGRAEIINAIKNIVKEKIDIDSINKELIDNKLYTKGYPDVDLIIRPSGEKRLSNFLIWQSAYAEFVDMDVLWPDFNKEDLEKALNEYRKRNRRFGGI